MLELLELLDATLCVGEFCCDTEMVERLLMADGIIELIHDKEILSDMEMM